MSPSSHDLQVAAKALSRGLITPDQLAEALAQVTPGGIRPLSEYFLARGWIDEETSNVLLQCQNVEPTHTLASGHAALQYQPSSAHGPELGRRYEIIELIGVGGMGAVWKALDHQLGRYVAIKEPHTADPRHVRHEALILATLRHPNVIALLDADPT